MSARQVVVKFYRRRFSIKGVDQDQFYLHFIRKQAFNKYAGLLARPDAVPFLCQSRQIRGEFYKNSIILH